MDQAIALARAGDKPAALAAFAAMAGRRPHDARLHLTCAALAEELGAEELGAEELGAEELGAEELGQADQARHFARRALAAEPGLAAALAACVEPHDMASALRRLMRLSRLRDGAIDLGRWLLVAQTLHDRHYAGVAEAVCQQVLALVPDSIRALCLMGQAMLAQGRADDGLACQRRALAIAPDSAAIHANLLMSLCYAPQVGPDEIRARHLAWAETLRRTVRGHANDRDPERRLRVGYVSGDLASHPVGFFIERLLEHHDRGQVEVVCYSNRPADPADPVAARLRGLSGHWRTIIGDDDDQVAALVRADGIDILVDLSGHTAGHRLGVFARKPAPVQVAWLGYFTTTGLGAMDAVLMDAVTVPPGGEREFVEPVIRLPRSRLCYAPPRHVPPPRRAAHGGVTFGSFNNLAKLSPPTLDLWAAVLAAVPAARLRLKWACLIDPAVRDRFAREFARRGIDPARLELRGPSGHAEMLAEYGEIDIALDPFPFSGALTTCEALWMGVPVVTLPGRTAVSRQTAAILTAAGCPQWVAWSPAEYIAIAGQLAAGPAALEALRPILRARMAASPLCDGAGFARDVEAALRGLWRSWCA